MNCKLIISIALVSMMLCSCRGNKEITQEMALEGVTNYCHQNYDWSIAKENPEIMYIQNGEETEKEYEVIFRSYTGALIHFYVDKTTGKTKIVEVVPTMNVKEEAGTIDLFEYLEK